MTMHKMDDLMLIADLSMVRAVNTTKLNEVDGDQSSAVGLTVFEHNGQEIYDPFLDESGRTIVDPLEYYGRQKMEQLVYRYYDF